METRYTEKRGVTSKYIYKFMGYGLDSKPIYAEYLTTFSISKGVIKDCEFVRYCTEDYKTYNSFIR